jgi:predicted  nucleic acid-binding Zn-ribbon protein
MKLEKYREELQSRVVKIETILEERLPRIDESLSKIEQHLGIQNGRIRNLEDSKLKIYSIAGVVSFITPLILKAVGVI